MNREFRRLALFNIAASAGILSGFADARVAEDTANITVRAPMVKYGDTKITLSQMLKDAGLLTDYVEKKLELPTDFKSRFLRLGPGHERENLVYEEIVKRKPFGKLVPVTVTLRDGTTITYSVMPDYITIDGIRVPMSGRTAQRVADRFGMVLPTSKMSRQIWEAADVKTRPTPLSASGFRSGGKHYSAKEVVQNKIGDSDAAVAYSELIEKELAGKEGKLRAGHMKDVIAPEDDPANLGLYGWSGASDKWQPIQDSPTTGHDVAIHTEYGAGTRLVGGKVVVRRPDGQIVSGIDTMDKLMDHPNYSKAVSNTVGRKKYNTRS